LLVAGPGAFAAEGNTPAEGAKKFTRTLYLVRHGAYDESPGGEPGVGKGLTTLGKEQARLAGIRLAGLPHAPTSLTTSTMTRARETAAIIGERLSLDARVTPLIAECIPSFREGELKRPPGDSSKACEERVDRAYEEMMAPATDRDRYDVIVFHGNAMRYWILKALGVDTKAWPRLWVRNASITTIRIDGNGTIRVLGVGDAGHLPPE
jgi:serine/threonine-protein phosphatase PGAM5